MIINVYACFLTSIICIISLYFVSFFIYIFIVNIWGAKQSYSLSDMFVWCVTIRFYGRSVTP